MHNGNKYSDESFGMVQCWLVKMFWYLKFLIFIIACQNPEETLINKL